MVICGDNQIGMLKVVNRESTGDSAIYVMVIVVRAACSASNSSDSDTIHTS